LHHRPIVGLAKSQHRDAWLGRFSERIWSQPGLGRPYIEYIDRDQPAVDQLIARLDLRFESASLLVHVEGTRRRSARRGRVQAMNPIWTDLAATKGWAIVPVRFIGGLPVEDPGFKQDLPVGFGRQIIRLGPALTPDILARAGGVARMGLVRAAINELSDNRTEAPSAPDAEFGAAVAAWVARHGGEAPLAAILQAFLRRVRALRPEVTILADHGACRPTDAIDAFAAACHLAERTAMPVTLELADDAEGRWMRDLGRLLVGPRGPEIVVGGAPAIRIHDDGPAQLCV
jgi:hypothetical protein